MFARLATLVLCVLPVLAVPTNAPAGSCTTGEVMCCNSANNADPSNQAQGLAGILEGLIGITIPLDVKCIPVNVIGANGQSCTGQVACCANNNVNALVSLQCMPLNINA
ncbi:Fruiting body protein SC3 [Termitomyces sp. J132]|nr:Fruiting body protein SC3 [Termitomyces sp. J132]